MSHDKFPNLPTSSLVKMIVAVLCIAIVSSFLAACGSTVTAANSAPSPTPTFVPTPTPTLVPTPTPTPMPTFAANPTSASAPVPQQMPAPVPASPPPAPTGAPAILDLRPLSMSIVGHLDCQRNGAYVCFARVLSRPNAQSNLHWFAFTASGQDAPRLQAGEEWPFLVGVGQG